MKRALTMKTAARRIRALADLGDEMLEAEDKRHWDKSNDSGGTGDPGRDCSDCRTIDLAREVADHLDPRGKGGHPRRPATGRAI
jgi:hypothetical protein